MEWKISIEPGKFEEYYKKALSQIKRGFELPGFRPGTVPEKVIEEKIGESRILEEAAELAIKDEWAKILRELDYKGIEAIGRPEVTITKIARKNSLEFKIQASVIDKINLPEYKKISKEVLGEKKNIEATEEEINKALEYIKKNSKDNHAHTEEELRNAIKENMQKEKEIRQKSELRMKILDEISKKTKADLPEILIESELNRMIAEYQSSVSDMGIKWEDYLKSLKDVKSEEDLRKNWRENAQKRAKYGLVMREIAKKENLVPSKEFLEKESDEFLRKMTDEERKKVSKENVKEYLFGRIRNEMVFDFLEKQ
ncbi:MAG: trigger factor [Patescibacteria group bacterium]